MNDPRYVVTEIEGYLNQAKPRGSQVPGLSVHVLDTAFCHRVVFTARTENVRQSRAESYAGMTPWEARERVRGLARARALELNAA